MFRPTVNITIGSHNFKFCTHLKLNSTWKKFTDTGTLTIPNKFVLNGQSITIGNNNVFNRGDAISISCGYYPKSEVAFEGFVSKIIPQLPLIIEFEDYSWVLKQTNVTFSLTSTSLKNMLQTALTQAISKAKPGVVLDTLNTIQLDCVDANIGSFRVTRVSIAQILDELKKTYALTSYFRGGTLHCGLAYTGDGNNFTYSMEDDIDQSKSKLEYVKTDDVRIKIKGISMLPNNKKIEVDAGDPDGEQRTLFKYNLTQAQLMAACVREADNFRYEGWRGSFRTFLHKGIVKHGDKITLNSVRLPEQNGTYYCAGVTLPGGTEGYFMDIELGAKIIAGVSAF